VVQTEQNIIHVDVNVEWKVSHWARVFYPWGYRSAVMVIKFITDKMFYIY